MKRTLAQDDYGLHQLATARAARVVCVTFDRKTWFVRKSYVTKWVSPMIALKRFYDIRDTMEQRDAIVNKQRFCFTAQDKNLVYHYTILIETDY